MLRLEEGTPLVEYVVMEEENPLEQQPVLIYLIYAFCVGDCYQIDSIFELVLL